MSLSCECELECLTEGIHAHYAIESLPDLHPSPSLLLLAYQALVISAENQAVAAAAAAQGSFDSLKKLSITAADDHSTGTGQESNLDIEKGSLHCVTPGSSKPF